MRIKILNILLLTLLLTGQARAERELFVFDNGVRGLKTPKEKVAVLKELGYAGIISRSGEIAALLPELDTAGLKMIGSYVPVIIDGETIQYDKRLPKEIEMLKGRGTYIWLHIRGDRKKDMDDPVVKIVREVADMAEKAGLQVALYPHTGFYVATALESLRIIEKVDRPNVGVMFNLCHFLMQNNIDELEKVVRKIAPRMNMVSINGADLGSRLPLNQSLQRLDKGSFDNAKLLRLLDEVGYKGPVCLQCYNIQGDDRENLSASMKKWKELNSQNKQQGVAK